MIEDKTTITEGWWGKEGGECGGRKKRGEKEEKLTGSLTLDGPHGSLLQINPPEGRRTGEGSSCHLTVQNRSTRFKELRGVGVEGFRVGAKMRGNPPQPSIFIPQDVSESRAAL